MNAMTMKGEALPNGAGFRCAGCGITVFANSDNCDNPQVPLRLCTSCFQRMPKLTTAQVRALAAVRDGLVTQRFDHQGNVFQGPKGIGAILYRKLQDARLIEDAPRQTGVGVIASFHKQQLTAVGRATLATIHSPRPKPEDSPKS